MHQSLAVFSEPIFGGRIPDEPEVFGFQFFEENEAVGLIQNPDSRSLNGGPNQFDPDLQTAKEWGLVQMGLKFFQNLDYPLSSEAVFSENEKKKQIYTLSIF